MQTTTHSNIALLAQLCEKKGITDVVISPGSRNAPISIAMNRQSGLTCHVVVDERCAAFVALGMAQKSNTCVALVCTSGTALLNQAPAIAEAYYQELPLLVISADRPEAWIDQADSQTIRQNGILANIVKHSYTLPSTTTKEGGWYACRTINEAINMATHGRRGPVHLNVPCELPLYSTTEFALDGKNTTQIYGQQARLNVCTVGKVMVLAGFMQPDETLNQDMRELAKQGVTVLAECVSNLYGDGIANNVESVFASLDEEEKEQLRPEVLIVLGGALVSKSAKEYFRNYPAKQTWRVGMEENIIDTFRSLDQQITSTPKDFVSQNKASLKGDPHYANRWIEKSRQCESALSASNGKWDEDSVFDCILSNIPVGSDLHLSNGTSVRNGQKRNNRKGLKFYSNRGTSGIDGCTSTAVGSALKNKDGHTTLITGDLSFLYDSNALWNDEFPGNLTIYIINNNGGGIFRKLKGPSETEEFEKYFVTPHHVDIATLCKAYGISHQKASNLEELQNAKGLGIIEVIIA